jgi:hypothetical protein
MKNNVQEEKKISKGILIESFAEGKIIRNNLSKLDRKIYKWILYWMCGNITYHQQCKNCGRTVDRIHAIECNLNIYSQLNILYEKIKNKLQERKMEQTNHVENHEEENYDEENNEEANYEEENNETRKKKKKKKKQIIIDYTRIIDDTNEILGNTETTLLDKIIWGNHFLIQSEDNELRHRNYKEIVFLITQIFLNINSEGNPLTKKKIWKYIKKNSRNSTSFMVKELISKSRRKQDIRPP